MIGEQVIGGEWRGEERKQREGVREAPLPHPRSLPFLSLPLPSPLLSASSPPLPPSLRGREREGEREGGGVREGSEGRGEKGGEGGEGGRRGKDKCKRERQEGQEREILTSVRISQKVVCLRILPCVL